MQRSAADRQIATIGEGVLVGLGLLFLVQQVLGVEVGRYGWPLFVILLRTTVGPAILILVAIYLLMRRRPAAPTAS